MSNPAVAPARPVEIGRSTHDEMLAMSLALTYEFSGRVAAGTVIRTVAEAREGLLAAGVREGLVLSVESMARARLGRRLAAARTSRGATG
jgi:hypothetical protein